MTDFYDISSWNEKPWYQTGGTRNKVIVENPTNHKDYYFKTSLKKEKIDYKYEFWSEIIASKVGSILGFDILNYDIAAMDNELGCLSKSMVTEGKNKLTEGISYLTGFDTTYKPEDKNSKKKYTFQLIRDALKHYRLEDFIENIIHIIIFDSIIGNGDRHQENWGIITNYKDIIATFKELSIKEKKTFFDLPIFAIRTYSSKAKRKEILDLVEKIDFQKPFKFSQIYDSGSCLGRELDDSKVKQMLIDNSLIEIYIGKGTSEIHWEGKKLNHFDLIEKINNEYPEIVKNAIQQVNSKFDEKEIQSIVENIDVKLPSSFETLMIPKERKELMIKFLTLRVQKLIKIIS